MFALGTILPLANNAAQTGYATSDLSSAGIGLAYNGPLLAAVTAYSLRGWAKVHRPLRSVRSGPAVVLMIGWPLLVGGPVVGCLAVLVSARVLPDEGPGWMLLLTFFAVLLCSATIGVALSWALPVVLSVPLAAVIPYAWINYLPATDSRVLHQFTPALDGFANSSEPATVAAVALLLLSFTTVAGLVLLLTVTRWDSQPGWLTAPMFVAVVAAASVLAWGSLGWASQPLNLLAAQPRSTGLVCADRAGVEVCLWPESEDRSAEVADAASAMNDVLDAWGLEEVTAIWAGRRPPGAAGVDATPGGTSTNLLASLAIGYLDQRLDCRVLAGRFAEERVAALVLSVSGDARASEQFGRETLDNVRAQLGQAPGEIGAWFDVGLTELRCDTLS